jgi:hypothetical protein
MRSIVLMIVLLAVTAGVLGWLVVPAQETRCLYAITVGTDFQGYEEVPCRSGVKDVLEERSELRDLLPDGPTRDLRPAP